MEGISHWPKPVNTVIWVATTSVKQKK
jgi:hypothetical protein